MWYFRKKTNNKTKHSEQLFFYNICSPNCNQHERNHFEEMIPKKVTYCIFFYEKANILFWSDRNIWKTIDS